MSSPLPSTSNMAVTFLDVERGDTSRRPSDSNFDLSKYQSAAPTLNNTPNGSRPSSPARKIRERSPTPSPKQEDLERMDSQLSQQAARLTGYSTQELDIAYMGNVIILCFFTSGMIDAVAFNSWNCFVGMQTGKLGSVSSVF